MEALNAVTVLAADETERSYLIYLGPSVDPVDIRPWVLDCHERRGGGVISIRGWLAREHQGTQLTDRLTDPPRIGITCVHEDGVHLTRVGLTAGDLDTEAEVDALRAALTQAHAIAEGLERGESPE